MTEWVYLQVRDSVRVLPLEAMDPVDAACSIADKLHDTDKRKRNKCINYNYNYY